MHITTISSWVLLIAETLKSYGVDYRQLFRQAGMDAAHLSDQNARFDFFSVTRLWDLALEKTQDPCFGLVAVNHWHPTSLHALGFSWMASPSLKDAFERLQRYIRIVNNAAAVDITTRNSVTRIVIYSAAEPLKTSIASMDAALAVLLHMCRLNYGRELDPVRIRTMRPEPTPACVDRFNAFYRAPIEFSSGENAIDFKRDVLEKHLPASNIDLARANDKIIDEYLSHLDGVSVGIRTRVKITELLPSGSVTEEKIASLLNLSVRSMQRKLKEEGASFKELLNQTRQELADQYIENSRLSINEITYLLGFSDPANFSRAFKRWHGVSPSQYRG
ncbi:MAG: AraC family transcriptional regulator [Gammaproteobacteria bacterium]|nr:AraC family transcriptional regulator [Gammaproteobacteria bacterium]